ncbi:MAG: lytic transglycosylase domain-containing protein [Thermodesulfobacteriota bacterium]
MTGARPRVKKSKLLLPAGLAGFLLLAGAFLASATEIYMFRDNRGVIHFTNAPTDTRFRPFKVTAQIKVGSSSLRLDADILQPYIKTAAKQYSLDPALITAVIKVESAFDPYAVSWAGAQGLMQLMPGTATLMNVGNSFSPRENIMGGSGYLKRMLDRFQGDLKLALAAYNIGPERVALEKKIPDVAETQAYVKMVLQYYDLYKRKK